MRAHTLNMTKFGLLGSTEHVERNICETHDHNDNSIDSDIENIEIKPIILRKPNKLKPSQLLYDVQLETLKIYENAIINKSHAEKQRDFNVTLNDVKVSRENNVIERVLDQLNDIKISDECKLFEDYSLTRNECQKELKDLIDRINGMPKTLCLIYKVKAKIDILYENFIKCREIILIDLAQIEMILSRLPKEVSNCIVKLHGNIYEFVQQRFKQCTDVSIANLKVLYLTRLFLHKVFFNILTIVRNIGQECTKYCTFDTLKKTKNYNKEEGQDLTASHELVTSAASVCKPNVPQENLVLHSTTENDLSSVENLNISKNSSITIEMPNNDCSNYFNMIFLEQQLSELADEQSKQFFMNEGNGKSRQILHKEIIIEINRIGGFDLHLKTIQPILKRLFYKPDELDPDSRSLNLVDNKGALQYYCETLVDSVKKLFYTPIPDREIVTPVLAHYIASLSISNPYFRLYIQYNLMNISYFYLLDIDSNESMTVDFDMFKLEKLDNIYHFMAFLYLTPSGVGIGEETKVTCFGLRNAWHVLARVANSNSPYVELKVIIAYRFLQICGFAMMVCYQNQFVKLLNYMIMNCIPIWRKTLSDYAFPFYIKLHDLIHEACLCGMFDRPKYLNKKLFPSLNRTNIPKFNDKELFFIKHFRLSYD